MVDRNMKYRDLMIRTKYPMMHKYIKDQVPDDANANSNDSAIKSRVAGDQASRGSC